MNVFRAPDALPEHRGRGGRDRREESLVPVRRHQRGRRAHRGTRRALGRHGSMHQGGARALRGPHALARLQHGAHHVRARRAAVAPRFACARRRKSDDPPLPSRSAECCCDRDYIARVRSLRTGRGRSPPRRHLAAAMGGCADVLEHSRERHVRDFRSGRRPRRVGHVRGRCGAMVSALTDTRRGWRNLRAAERRSFRRHRQTRSRYVGARAPGGGRHAADAASPASRDWPVDIPALLFGATRRARGWQGDAIPVWLEYQYVDAPNPAARGPQLRIGFVSPTTGTGMRLTLRENEERTAEFNQRVNWGTTSLPPMFIDLPTAVRKARENGMQGTLGRARLAVHHPPGAPEILAWMISPSSGEGRTVEGTSGAIIDFDVTGYIASYNAQWERRVSRADQARPNAVTRALRRRAAAAAGRLRRSPVPRAGR